MNPVKPCALPAHALLQHYTRNGAYTDCYVADLAMTVTHAQYVEAFYTTGVFKLERLILRWAVKRPSSDAQARQLAAGSLYQFAAWGVEERTADQLLMCDLFGRTRSWLMSEPQDSGTRLYFGSAVVPAKSAAPGQLGFPHSALLGFHRLYSRVLLGAARRRLMAGT